MPSTSLSCRVGLLLALGLAPAWPAFAHGPTVAITLGSTAPGGGALRADFDFASVVPVTFSTALGDTSVYTTGAPSIDARTSDGDGAFALADGTEIRLEVTALDGGTTGVKIGATVLDAAGESVVLGTYDASAGSFHVHPEWQLLVAQPPGGYAEGRLAFRLTSTSPVYAVSQSYELRFSTGHLPPLALDTAAYDAPALACRKTVAAATRTFALAKHKALAKCLDKVGVADARRAAGLDDGKARAAAVAECDADLLAKIDGARAKAVTQIEKKCGPFAAVELGSHAAAAHLAFVGCEVDRFVGASYGGAAKSLESFQVDGSSLLHHFPCLAGETATASVP